MNEVVVVQGDTLWSIAKTYNSSDNDIRELIYYIKKINQLTTAQIHPGQTLFIPNL
ncbi:MAG: LysM peptidoglycan-binding domain-containing protein [Halanaerobiales bacterium]|nr:LysM peptidoglycan-binding domain-containing protein [Halanaerobiales bacterium]